LPSIPAILRAYVNQVLFVSCLKRVEDDGVVQERQQNQIIGTTTRTLAIRVGLAIETTLGLGNDLLLGKQLLLIREQKI
jgi:hypothetical protein